MTSTPKATNQSAYFKANGKGFIEDWLDGKTWIDKSRNYGKTRKCRICKKPLGRTEHYLNLDRYDHSFRMLIKIQIPSVTATINKPVKISICQHCVSEWADKLKSLNNNDNKGNSTPEC